MNTGKNTDTENGIELEAVSYTINGRGILQDISMVVPKGMFAGILGANGAGKTTLLKCINGINPCSGIVRVWGRSRQDCTEKEFARIVSLMNQNTQLDFSFTCRQVVEFGRYPYWKKGYWSGKGDAEIIEQAMRDTGTLELADVPITSISGGERQRVLFAKVLAQDTNVVLLDEPTANLDLFYQRQMFAFGKELAGNGKTVVAAVHDLNLALQYCEYFYLLHNGRLLARGPADEVMTPENMKQAYQLDTLLYQNPYLPGKELAAIDLSPTLSGIRVHLMCGRGTGRRVLFHLWQQGAQVSVCPLPEGDLDLEAAMALGIPLLNDKEVLHELETLDPSKKAAIIWFREGNLEIKGVPQFHAGDEEKWGHWFF